MATIRVKYRGVHATATIPRIFEDNGRGSPQTLSSDGPFAVITDPYGGKTYIPHDRIEEIVVDETARRSF